MAVSPPLNQRLLPDDVALLGRDPLALYLGIVVPKKSLKLILILSIR